MHIPSQRVLFHSFFPQNFLYLEACESNKIFDWLNHTVSNLKNYGDKGPDYSHVSA